MAPASHQKVDFEHFRALGAKWPQEALRSYLQLFSEGSFRAFSGLGRQMALGGPQKAQFQHFQAVGAKWLQEATRRLILSISGPWAPNGPRRPSEGSF